MIVPVRQVAFKTLSKFGGVFCCLLFVQSESKFSFSLILPHSVRCTVTPLSPCFSLSNSLPLVLSPLLSLPSSSYLLPSPYLTLSTYLFRKFFTHLFLKMVKIYPGSRNREEGKEVSTGRDRTGKGSRSLLQTRGGSRRKRGHRAPCGVREDQAVFTYFLKPLDRKR